MLYILAVNGNTVFTLWLRPFLSRKQQLWSQLYIGKNPLLLKTYAYMSVIKYLPHITRLRRITNKINSRKFPWLKYRVVCINMINKYKENIRESASSVSSSFCDTLVHRNTGIYSNTSVYILSSCVKSQPLEERGWTEICLGHRSYCYFDKSSGIVILLRHRDISQTQNPWGCL